MLRLRSKPKTPPPEDETLQPSPALPPPRKRKTNGFQFTVNTPIARAAGKDGKYACGCVRVLPSVNRNQVVLEVTDGHQAACVLAPGKVPDAQHVPTKVLPQGAPHKPVSVRLVDECWQSSDGKTVEASLKSQTAFPPIGQVLPAVGKKPLYQTPGRAKRSNGEPMHIVLGIDVDVLRKTVLALGTSKLTLFVALPVRDARSKSNVVCVDQAIPICPAENEGGAEGVAVVMPLKPSNTNAYYTRMRDIVMASEKRSAKRVGKTR